MGSRRGDIYRYERVAEELAIGLRVEKRGDDQSRWMVSEVDVSRPTFSR